MLQAKTENDGKGFRKWLTCTTRLPLLRTRPGREAIHAALGGGRIFLRITGIVVDLACSCWSVTMPTNYDNEDSYSAPKVKYGIKQFALRAGGGGGQLLSNPGKNSQRVLAHRLPHESHQLPKPGMLFRAGQRERASSKSESIAYAWTSNIVRGCGRVREAALLALAWSGIMCRTAIACLG